MEWRERAALYGAGAAGFGGLATGDAWWFGAGGLVLAVLLVMTLVVQDDDWDLDVGDDGDEDGVPPEDRSYWGDR